MVVIHTAWYNPRVQPLAPAYLVNEYKIELRVKDRLLDGLADIDVESGQ